VEEGNDSAPGSGAPLCHPESKISLDDWDGKRVRRAHFRSIAQELLADSPKSTFSEVVRWFIRNEGGPNTIARFLERFPWARSGFGHIKQKHADDQRRKDELVAMLVKKRRGLNDVINS
jgi:hypothetical protein